MSIRAEKVASTIKRELAEPISRIGTEKYKGLVTLTTVKMSPDLQIAKLYVSIFGKGLSVGEVIEGLENDTSELKQYIAKNLRLRYVPELKFYLDDTLDKMDHIQELLDSVNSNTNTDEEK
jgi:ribosome-binding factor A